MSIFGYTLTGATVTKAITIILIILLTWLVVRYIGRFIRRSIDATGTIPAAGIFVNIARVVVLVIGLMTILSVLDVSITPVITALGVGGLALSLALQDTLGNFFAGLQIIATRQINPGDFITLSNGEAGTVVDIAWRTTTLRTETENLVIVPNAVLSQSIVTNYKLPERSFYVFVDFGVEYGTDLDYAESVALEVATEVMHELEPTLTDEPPVVRFREFADSQITGIAVLRVANFGQQYALRGAFVKRLHKRFLEEGINFPFPTRTVHIVP